ncbi:MAG: GAF domain-containing protein, partial [Olleya sp.]
MIDLNDNINLPFSLQISFNKLIERYNDLAKSEDSFIAAKANRILEIGQANTLLKEGFSKISVLKKYEKEIAILLEDSFSEVLS